MAIVFISPKEKRKVFFSLTKTAVILSLLVIILSFSIAKFLTRNRVVMAPSTSQKDIIIDLSIIDSDKVKSLEPFLDLEMVFSYVAQDQEDKQVQGNISATRKEEAQKLLEGIGLKVISLKELSIGRNHPFIAY